MKISEINCMENLFKRFMILKGIVQGLAGIVQNQGTEVSKEEFEDWRDGVAAPALLELNNLINDVERYYFDKRLCPFCFEYHTGGPENCRDGEK